MDSGYNVFIINTEKRKIQFLAWILRISVDEFDSGFDFLLKNNNSAKILWELIKDIPTITVVLEDHYVDRVYRDSYYFYYSGKHFTYSRFCKRLSLFYGKLENDFADYSIDELKGIFIGTIVIRPLPEQSIGRTLLNPKYFLKDESVYIRVVTYSVTIYGKKLDVKAFPYSMQDGETTSCAEITILNLLDYYSQSYPEYHYLLPSEINHLAEKSSYERKTPTRGMSYECISKIFCEAGFYPRLYSTQKMSKDKFHHVLSYYIESGIPVALGLKLPNGSKHSIICIGHMKSDTSRIGEILNCSRDDKNSEAIWVSDTADLIDAYCIMDDNRRPYYISRCLEKSYNETKKGIFLELDGYELEYMMVPLYKRMILEATDAYEICMSAISSSNLGIKSFVNLWPLELKKQLLGDEIAEFGSKENPIIVRLYMASSRTFKKERDIKFMQNNKEAQDFYNSTVFPKFVWICELSSKKMYTKGNDECKVIGEIIIDATSSADAGLDSVILINYPHMIYRRMPENFFEKGKVSFEEVKNWNPFPIFQGNLEPYSPISKERKKRASKKVLDNQVKM